MDLLISVAVTLNMKKFDHTELDLYILTRKEYAETLGISANAVRMKQRRGKLDGEFRFDGNKFLFKLPERPRVTIGNDPSKNTKLTAPKKKYNRGNHFKATYPNTAFKLHNELMMYNKIKKNLPDSVLNEINPELVELAKQRAKDKQDELIKKSFTPIKNYGGPVRTQPRYNISYDRDKSYDAFNTSITPNRTYYEIGSNHDDGSVEIDLSRSRDQKVPKFRNKIDEEVYYHPNNKKK